MASRSPAWIFRAAERAKDHPAYQYLDLIQRVSRSAAATTPDELLLAYRNGKEVQHPYGGDEIAIHRQRVREAQEKFQGFLNLERKRNDET